VTVIIAFLSYDSPKIFQVHFWYHLPISVIAFSEYPILDNSFFKILETEFLCFIFFFS